MTIGELQRRVPLRSFAFLFAAAMRRVGTLAWAPLLLLAFPADDFTKFGLLQSSIYTLAPLICLNITLAPSRLLFDKTSTEAKRCYVTSTFLTLLALCLLTVTIANAGLAMFSSPFLSSILHWPINVAFSAYVVTFLLSEFSTSIARATGDLFVINASAIVSLLVGLPAFYLLYTKWNFTGITAVAIANSMGFLTVFLIAGIRQRALFWPLSFSAADSKESLRFSAPTTVHLVAIGVLCNVGRWVGAAYLPLNELALFTFLSMLSGAITAVPIAVFDATLPEFTSRFSNNLFDDGKKILSNCTNLSIAIILTPYLCLPFIHFFIDPRLLPEDLFSDSSLILFSCFNILHVYYIRGVHLMYGLKETSRLAVCSTSAAILSALAAIAGVLLLRSTGLAIAMLGGMSALSLLVNFVARNRLRARESLLGNSPY